MKRLKSLCFIAGAVATAAQTKWAIKEGFSFRNSLLIGENDNPEPCDQVAGEVPAAYTDTKNWPKGQVPKVVKSCPASPKPKGDEPKGDEPKGDEPKGTGLE